MPKHFLVIINEFLPYFLFNEFAHAESTFLSTSFSLISNSTPLQNCTNFALWHMHPSYLKFTAKFSFSLQSVKRTRHCSTWFMYGKNIYFKLISLVRYIISNAFLLISSHTLSCNVFIAAKIFQPLFLKISVFFCFIVHFISLFSAWSLGLCPFVVTFFQPKAIVRSS